MFISVNNRDSLILSGTLHSLRTQTCEDLDSASLLYHIDHTSCGCVSEVLPVLIRTTLHLGTCSPHRYDGTCKKNLAFFHQLGFTRIIEMSLGDVDFCDKTSRFFVSGDLAFS